MHVADTQVFGGQLSMEDRPRYVADHADFGWLRLGSE